MSMSRPPRADARDDVCLAVVERIAEREGVRPGELEPRLYEVIDPDAVAAVVSSGSSVTVSFAYGDYAVAVDSDGTVRVEERGADLT
jgi:hypothetical protein